MAREEAGTGSLVVVGGAERFGGAGRGVAPPLARIARQSCDVERSASFIAVVLGFGFFRERYVGL